MELNIVSKVSFQATSFKDDKMIKYFFESVSSKSCKTWITFLSKVLPCNVSLPVSLVQLPSLSVT